MHRDMLHSTMIISVLILLCLALPVSAEEQIPVQPGDPWTPAALDSDSLGQEILATIYFDTVNLHTPTWHNDDSRFTLVIKQDGPKGSQLFEVDALAIDGQTTISTDPLPPGRYYIEMKNPIGQIGWWTKEDNPYPDGVAYVDGKPVADQFRVLALSASSELIQREPATDEEIPYTGDASTNTFIWLALLCIIALISIRIFHNVRRGSQ